MLEATLIASLMTYSLPDATKAEQHVLQELQEIGITDKNALATVMGNIKQESLFYPNICEGGARVKYENCYTGGYGLIQWTTVARYDGLGSFANKYGCDPSTLKCQTRYMINENQFQHILPDLKKDGGSISDYMKPAYYWLGWGVYGLRGTYANEYASRLTRE